MSHGDRNRNEMLLDCVHRLQGRRGLLIVEKAPDGQVTDHCLVDDGRVAAIEASARDGGRPTTAIVVPGGEEMAVTAIVGSYDPGAQFPIMQDNPGGDLPHVWLCPIDRSCLN